MILESLDYIHTRGYLHLDIKPANILINDDDPDFTIKLSDFGSGWLFQDDDSINEVKGTPYFMAPEACIDMKRRPNNGYFSGRQYDTWSAGVAIYAMVFNELPYKPASSGF
jgi:serine/threonine protein kinase